MTKRGHGEGSLEWDAKRGYYFVKITYTDPVTGEKKRKKLKGTTKKAESLRIGQQWLKELENGLLPEASKVTLGEWIDRWIEDYVKPKVRPKSYDKYESCLRLYIKPALKDVPMATLKTPDVQRVLNRLIINGGEKGEGISATTVRSTRRYLSMCLDQAIKVGLLTRNVVKATEPPKLVKKEIRPLTQEQATALLDVAKEAGTIPHIVILIALSTGMRLGEIFGLKWSDIDLSKGVVHVQRSLVTANKRGKFFQEPKTAKSRRRIALPKAVNEALLHYKTWQDGCKSQLGDKWSDMNLVVTNQMGKPHDTGNFTSRIFKPLLTKAGIEQSFRFHDLRHTHATLLLQQGVNSKVVQERLGHSTITLTLDTYSHLLPDMQDVAVKALEGVFEADTDHSD